MKSEKLLAAAAEFRKITARYDALEKRRRNLDAKRSLLMEELSKIGDEMFKAKRLLLEAAEGPASV